MVDAFVGQGYSPSEALAAAINVVPGAKIGRIKTPAAKTSEQLAYDALEPGTQAWRNAPNPYAKFPQYAEEYPPVGPPKLKPKTAPSYPGETYEAKELTPEARAFAKERLRIQKELDQDFEPYFLPQRRYDVNPADYPLRIDTSNIPGETVPKTPTAYARQYARVGTPEIRQRLQDAYVKGIELGEQSPLGGRSSTQEWFLMGQPEAELRATMGNQPGRTAFQENIATPMAATTGGMNPEANLIASGYYNWLRSRGEQWPPTHQWPYPVGAQYGANLAETAQRIANEGGFQALGAVNPKRHNFAANIMGHERPATMDERMTKGMTGQAIPDWYGINERVLAEEAAKIGIPPREFQGIGWAGFGGEAGDPLVQEMNRQIERQHRLVGMPRSEIFRRAWGERNIPVYAVPAAIGTGALMGDLARQDNY
jgi:hypothetical protein